MKRQEYKLLIENWNTFLIEEEKRLINEQLIIESMLLNETFMQKIRDSKLAQRAMYGLLALAITANTAQKSYAQGGNPGKAGLEQLKSNPDQAEKIANAFNVSVDDLKEIGSEVEDNSDIEDQADDALLRLSNVAQKLPHGDSGENEILSSHIEDKVNIGEIFETIQGEIEKVKDASYEKLSKQIKDSVKSGVDLSEDELDEANDNLKKLGDQELKNMILGIKIMMFDDLMKNPNFKESIGTVVAIQDLEEGTINDSDFSNFKTKVVGYDLKGKISEYSLAMDWLISFMGQIDSAHSDAGILGDIDSDNYYGKLLADFKASLEGSNLGGTDVAKKITKLYKAGLKSLAQNQGSLENLNNNAFGTIKDSLSHHMSSFQVRVTDVYQKVAKVLKNKKNKG